MEYDKRCGFTLIEMLVVVILIGILSAGVLYAVSRARESGYASKCRANLRNLAQGVQNLTTESNGYLPYAGGYEWYNWRSAKWEERRGWVNWIPKSGDRPRWPHDEEQKSKMQQPAWYGPEGLRGIREGSLWAEIKFINGVERFEPLNMMELSSYCCPRFRRKDVCGRTDAVRSYVMNGLFGYQHNVRSQGVRLSTMTLPASRTLLFAEMPVPAVGSQLENPNGGDQTLDAEGPNGTGTDASPYESIGFNHRVAGVLCGHVVFVGGHVELARMLETGENPTLGLAKGTR